MLEIMDPSTSPNGYTQNDVCKKIPRHCGRGDSVMKSSLDPSRLLATQDDDA